MIQSLDTHEGDIRKLKGVGDVVPLSHVYF